MKKLLSIIICVVIFSGCSAQTSVPTAITEKTAESTKGADAAGNFTDEMKMDNSDDTDAMGGADTNERTGDHKGSPYFSNIDFYSADYNNKLQNISADK